MTQYVFRGNLNAARFPLVSTFQGRSVIIPRFDQNFQKLANFSGGDADRDIGIPQIFYGHNIVPTAEGFQSVGYEETIESFGALGNDFDQAFIIRDVDENKGIFVPAAGKNYIYQAVNAAWQSISPFPVGDVAENDLVTVANLHGRTFIFYENRNMYEYDFNANTLDVVPLTGVTASNLKGICAAVTYLITWDADNQIYWSSVTDATDFVPDLSTGSGSEIPNDIKGNIVVILPFPNGFIVYTTKNAVLASYTGNIRFPWVFKEIAGSQGVEKPGYVSWEANAGVHYAWTTSGLFKIERTSAEPVFAELTDFIASRLFEDYDSATDVLTQTKLSANLFIGLTMIGTRFIILSYGVTRGLFTHAIIYDIGLKRFGKLKIPHVDCFDWPAPNFFGTRTYAQLAGLTYDDLAGTSYDELSTQQRTFTQPKKHIAFLQLDGTVQILDFDLTNVDVDAALFLGKFQLIRGKTFQILNAEFESVDLLSNFNVRYLATFNGKTFERSLTPATLERVENLARYGGRLTGENITLVIEGGFNLNTVQLTGQAWGDR